ncbi:FUSC family protein [Crocosphaera sp.]|uniref:FUSC family protein n=1 Tax=Crocosphaera sp. TaxID=2729996 RepID=UPI00262099DF|nr:FUSC family protein [Crocosphaera sp.]MDJ0579438.1 FUSC family protein [Crocosphaera sp.]
MNSNIYIIKLALGAALAFAIGNALHTRNMNYVLYGSILCIHPIAGDTISYVLDKLKSALLGTSFGMIVTVAFQGNSIISLPIGIVSLITAGYWFNLPKRLLSFAVIVTIIALSGSYSNEPFEYIGLRFWNIFLGSIVGIIVNIAFWPNRDVEKIDPALGKIIASISQLYQQIINDYKQGKLMENTQFRKQLINNITKQINGIESLLENAESEIFLPFVDETSYQRRKSLIMQIKSLFRLVLNLGINLEGGDNDNLHWRIQTELDNLITATNVSFKTVSKTIIPSSSLLLETPLDNLSELNQAISDRLTEISEEDISSSTINPSEIKRMSATIYGLRAIASELQELTN